MYILFTVCVTLYAVELNLYICTPDAGAGGSVRGVPPNKKNLFMRKKYMLQRISYRHLASTFQHNSSRKMST